MALVYKILKIVYNFQIRGDSIGFYKLLFRLVAQKPLNFFQNHSVWSKSPDEKFSPKSGNIDNNGSKPFNEPIKRIDEGMN